MFDRLKQHMIQYAMTHKMSMYKEQVSFSDFRKRQDTSKDAAERARSFLEHMSLEEKISYISGYDDLAVREIPRLGIPSVYASDATSGVRCFGPATSFPAAVAMAATWDRELIREAGAVIGEECRAQGVSILLGPGVNIARVPTCGRNFEYMGEDPYLAGEIAAGYIEGVQSRGVITTVKHFACNNTDYDRHKSNSVVDERTLHEIYLPAFKKAVQQAKSLGVMSSYNQINGRYASENAYLLKDILRDQWGFDGLVMSDWNSLYSTEGPITCGLDLEMPRGRWIEEKQVRKLLDEKRITEEDIDLMVYHLLHTFIRMGVFDRKAVDAQSLVRTKDHLRSAFKVACEGSVLLKNENSLLPLSRKDTKKLVVLGRNGLKTATGGGGSSFMRPHDQIKSIYDALRLNNPDIEVVYVESSRGLISDEDIGYVAEADAVVIATGFDSVTESECYDRSYEFPEHEQRLILQAAAANSRCIVLLHGGGDMLCAPWVEEVPAVMHLMYLGEFAGEVPERMLFGEEYPSGSLPFTMFRRYEDHPAVKNYVEHPERMSLKRIHVGQGNPKKRTVTDMVYEEGLMIGYRYADTKDVEPLFPFGHGLSYTDFSLKQFSVEKRGSTAAIHASIQNTGTREGKAVLQIYVHDNGAPVPRPEQELKGFEKILLLPGQEKEVHIDLKEEAFSYYSEDDHCWILSKGPFEIRAGFSSRDVRKKSTVAL